MSKKRRLANLQTIYAGGTGGRAPDVLREWEQMAAVPAWASAVREFAEERARRRYLAEVGWHGRLPDYRDWLGPDKPDWMIAIGAYDHPPFIERWQRELSDLAGLIETLGAEAGWQAWLREAEGWPPRYRGPGHNPSYPTEDQAVFDRILAKEQEMLDRVRSCPELASWRARSGWSPAMTAEEKLAFDAALMPEVNR